MQYIIIILITVMLYLIYDANRIKIVKYDIASDKLPKEFAGYKILQISDLHGKQYGKNNEKLIYKINNENPDIVVMTGDMSNYNFKKLEPFYKFIEQISKTHKVIYVLGNQEKGYSYEKLKQYKAKIRSYGVIILNNEKQIIKKDDKKINIYGMNYKRNMYLEPNTKKTKDKNYNLLLKDMGNLDKNEYNIFLTHDASNFETYAKWGADLTFAGHLHGGMIRIFGIGLLSPKREFFPKYSKGKYKIDNSTLISNTGLGKLRIFNPPEIIITQFK